MKDKMIIDKNDLILITGANGFVGSKVVRELLLLGFMNLRCFVRASSNLSSLDKVIGAFPGPTIEHL